MRRAVSALGILLALAWMPAASLLCFAERGEDASARLVLTASVQNATCRTGLRPVHESASKVNGPEPRSTERHERVLQAVSESLDTPPAVHFHFEAFVAGVVVEFFVPLEHAPPPVYASEFQPNTIPLPGGATSRGPPLS